VLNQVQDERCEWLVPGMLKDKILALLKSLHQRPRSRFVPLPDNATRIAAQFGTPDALSARAAWSMHCSSWCATRPRWT
jgi:ATP-dependent helicase HrpA